MKTLTSEFGDTLVLASILSSRLQDFLSPLLIRLDQALDRRLVRTFAALIAILLEQRYRATGLLLSELGAFLGGFCHAPAGTKRLSNLLRSPRWSSALLEDFLWSTAERQLHDLLCGGALPPSSWNTYREAVRVCSARYSRGDFIPSAECGACSL
jgi:hypothetical protein